MFTDVRSKKVIFVAHCLLNQNSISDGTAVYPAAFEELICTLMAWGVGIVQLPCPELCCLGLDRGDPQGAQRDVVVENTRIRAAMQEEGSDRRLELLVDYTMLQIEEYRRHGFRVLGILGANRSPCCGVETTSQEGREVRGEGVFMEKLHTRLRKNGWEDIPMTGLKASDDLEEKLAFLLW